MLEDKSEDQIALLQPPIMFVLLQKLTSRALTDLDL